jgi:hypothetical protein
MRPAGASSRLVCLLTILGSIYEVSALCLVVLVVLYSFGLQHDTLLGCKCLFARVRAQINTRGACDRAREKTNHSSVIKKAVQLSHRGFNEFADEGK